LAIRASEKHAPEPRDRLEKAGINIADYLPAVPLDPEDGEPLRFQRRNDRVVVYSLHKRGSSSGLVAYDPVNLSPPGVGIAVHLFDVEHRRQPPRPKPPESKPPERKQPPGPVMHID
jgi:hypothetical protein